MDSLAELLLKVGWSQRKLAAVIEVNPETVSRWKRGKTATPKVVLLYMELLAERMKL